MIIHKVNTARKAVAFTFDDGPNPTYTPMVLEIFKHVSGRATFFMIGEQMKKHPELVQEVINEGHEIGNHTYTHPKLSELNMIECNDELASTHELIQELTGAYPKIFRLPYFDYNEQTLSTVEAFHYPIIGAVNTSALDWEMPGVEHIVKESRKHLKNGSIFLFHDGFGDRSQTVEAVHILVNQLIEEGYELVTVSDLLKTEER